MRSEIYQTPRWLAVRKGIGSDRHSTEADRADGAASRPLFGPKRTDWPARPECLYKRTNLAPGDVRLLAKDRRPIHVRRRSDERRTVDAQKVEDRSTPIRGL